MAMFAGRMVGPKDSEGDRPLFRTALRTAWLGAIGGALLLGADCAGRSALGMVQNSRLTLGSAVESGFTSAKSDGSSVLSLLDYLFTTPRGAATLAGAYAASKLLARLSDITYARICARHAVPDIDAQLGTLSAQLSIVPEGPERAELLQSQQGLLSERAANLQVLAPSNFLSAFNLPFLLKNALRVMFILEIPDIPNAWALWPKSKPFADFTLSTLTDALAPIKWMFITPVANTLIGVLAGIYNRISHSGSAGDIRNLQ